MALTPKKKKDKSRQLLFHVHIAGFAHYEGLTVWDKLKPGTELQFYPEPDNNYDKYAIELYLGDEKLGYIPRAENREMAKITNMQWDIFQVLIANKSEEEHPNNMVKIAVYVIKNNATKTKV